MADGTSGRGGLFPGTLALVPEWGRTFLGDGVEQGRKYRDVIGRFGRFPHRNRALGRRSTPEEREFLATWDERAAPKGAAALGASGPRPETTS